jgi:putative hydrolase of the HAD superfamily
MKFRAVIFDLGGVVLGSPLRVFLDYETELGLMPGFIGRMIGENGADGAWPRLERGEIDMASFVLAFDAEAAARGARVSTAELMQQIAIGSQPRVAMVAAIRRLRSHGLRTAALTNNWISEDQGQKMDVLRPEFDVFVESAREGLRKPDPRIYALVCERLQVQPSETVFLDDIGSNLKPARAMGMTTIKVDQPEAALLALEHELGFVLG